MLAYMTVYIWMGWFYNDSVNWQTLSAKLSWSHYIKLIWFDDINKIQYYINYIDKNIKKITHDNTIGIIICKKDNNYVIEYSSDSRIIARKYELI